jgi:hypothetical protein
MPADLIATIVLPASSVLLGLLFPVAAGFLIVGLVRGVVDGAWRPLVGALLAAAALVAAGVALRTWGATLGTPEQLAGANATAALVFTTVTPWGVIASAVLVVVTLVRLYVGGAMRRRRDARAGRD